MRRVAILIALALGQPLDKFTNKWSFGKRDNDVLDNYLKVGVALIPRLDLFFLFQGEYLWMVVAQTRQDGESRFGVDNGS